MKPLTYRDKEKFETLKNVILEKLKEIRENKLIFEINYTLLCECVESAKRYNKINNYFLKNNDFNESVYSFSAFDNDIKKVLNFSLKPSEKNNIKTLFIYEVLKNQFATIQEFEYFKNDFLTLKI